MAKDCYFNKKDTIVSFRNTEKSDSQTGSVAHLSRIMEISFVEL